MEEAGRQEEKEIISHTRICVNETPVLPALHRSSRGAEPTNPLPRQLKVRWGKPFLLQELTNKSQKNNSATPHSLSWMRMWAIGWGTLHNRDWWHLSPEPIARAETGCLHHCPGASAPKPRTCQEEYRSSRKEELSQRDGVSLRLGRHAPGIKGIVLQKRPLDVEKEGIFSGTNSNEVY